MPAGAEKDATRFYPEGASQVPAALRVPLLVTSEGTGGCDPCILKDMLNAITEERIRVRYGETDQMGHAYYAQYLFWFEQARGAWCRDRGFTYKGLEEMGYFLPVLEVHARYKGEVMYDDLILVRIKMTAIKRNAIRFDYEIVNAETGKTVTEGYTWHLLVTKDLSNVGVPTEVMDLLQRDPTRYSRLE